MLFNIALQPSDANVDMMLKLCVQFQQEVLPT